MLANKLAAAQEPTEVAIKQNNTGVMSKVGASQDYTVRKAMCNAAIAGWNCHESCALRKQTANNI